MAAFLWQSSKIGDHFALRITDEAQKNIGLLLQGQKV